LLTRIVSELHLPVTVASSTLGKLIGTATSVKGLYDVLSRWRENWNVQEVKQLLTLLLPIAVDDSVSPRDWVFVRVQASRPGVKLGLAEQLHIFVYDWANRKSVADRLVGFVHALFAGSDSDRSPCVVREEMPSCPVSTQRSCCVLGLIADFVQKASDRQPLNHEASTFVPDFCLVLKAVFARLRSECGARALSDLNGFVRGRDAEQLLDMFGVIPSMRDVMAIPDQVRFTS
jgi:hypothetical protein